MLFTIILCILLFLLYLHWVEQYRTGEIFDIYEIDYSDNQNLQDVCKSKQPIVFEFLSPHHYINTITLDDLANKYGKLDVFIKDTEEIEKGDNRPIPLSFRSAISLVKTDTRSHYCSQGNQEFIQDTVLERYYDSFHEFIKPPFTIHKKVDLLFGSKGTKTILQYDVSSEHFLYVAKGGKIRVKMTPHKSKKYFRTIKDYEQYEFYGVTVVDDRVQWLDFDVSEMNMLYIPPYWWYSIEYETDDCFLCSFQYYTMMNIVANGHNIGYSLLEQWRTPSKPVKQITINKENQETETISLPTL